MVSMSERVKQMALSEAIKNAQKDLEDHSKDDIATRRFLSGVIDGLKKAQFIVAQKSK